MKSVNYLFIIIISACIFYSCGSSDNVGNSNSSNNSSLNKCEGKQMYIKYKFEDEPMVEIPLDKMKTISVFSEYMEMAKYSSFMSDFYTNESEANIMLSSNGFNFKKGNYDFPNQESKKGTVQLGIEEGKRRGVYQAQSGTLQIDAWNYIDKGRRENAKKDFAKGKYKGQFKKALGFGDETLYPIEIEFCLCGEWEKDN